MPAGPNDPVVVLEAQKALQERVRSYSGTALDHKIVARLTAELQTIVTYYFGTDTDMCAVFKVMDGKPLAFLARKSAR